MSFWTKLLPKTQDPILCSRAALVIATALGVMLVLLALILTWLVSGDLEWQTVVAGIVFSGIMAGIVVLARAGRIRWSAWTLIIILMLATTLSQIGYGLGSPGTAGFFIPLVLAACVVSLRAGLAVALLSSSIVWAIGIMSALGPYATETFELSHLTFNAPMWTTLYFLIAALVGFWTRMLSQHIEKSFE